MHYAFAEINSQSINDEVEYTDEGKNSSYPSTSEIKSKLNVKNPFGSTDGDGNKKVNLNIIIPDMVEPDLPGSQPGFTASSDQIGTHQSIKEAHPNSVDSRSSSNIDNADGSTEALL